jgi:hypothetical protein
MFVNLRWRIPRLCVTTGRVALVGLEDREPQRHDGDQDLRGARSADRRSSTATTGRRRDERRPLVAALAALLGVRSPEGCGDQVTEVRVGAATACEPDQVRDQWRVRPVAAPVCGFAREFEKRRDIRG